MKKELKQKILDYWNNSALDYRLGKISELNLLKLACEHFYNLAASDIKEELKKRFHRNDYSDNEWDEGYDNCCEEMICFIDNILK